MFPGEAEAFGRHRSAHVGASVDASRQLSCCPLTNPSVRRCNQARPKLYVFTADPRDCIMWVQAFEMRNGRLEAEDTFVAGQH